MAVYYADVKTRGEKLGAIIIAEETDEVIGECLKWQMENNIKSEDMLPAKMISRETGETIGTVLFEEHGVSFTPCM